jgi:UDPglucose 6-dehydrogenase
MKVCMVGTGYVGLVSGACFAETGNHVVCADIDKSKIAILSRGEIPIFEPNLDTLVERNVQANRLSFSSDVGEAIGAATALFVAVGTPPRSDGAADLSAVDKVAESVAKHVKHESVLVLKSTVPVGTNARVRRIVADAPHPVHVVSNPEFLKEGAAIDDFMRPDRIVIGCDADDDFARDIMRRLYHPVTLAQERIIWMDPASAELTKYVANTMLAMRISFMNEVATLCEKVGADVHMVRAGVGSDRRIGPKFLYAGPGYGGSCFPKDVIALTNTGHEHGLVLELPTATDRVNRRQQGVLARKLKQDHFDGDLRGKRIGVWGIAFKPGTDDLRDGPALPLIEALLSEGAEVRAHDPAAMDNAREYFGDRISLFEDAYQVAEGADALVLVTEWREYQNPDFGKLKSLMRRPLLLDGRNIWSGYGLREQGLIYDGIGVRGS